MERFTKYIDLKINLTTIITVIILIGSWIAGYQELKAAHSGLAAEVHRHIDQDKDRFAALATKETGAIRDREVDTKISSVQKSVDDKFAQILLELQDNKARLERIERMHMK